MVLSLRHLCMACVKEITVLPVTRSSIRLIHKWNKAIIDIRHRPRCAITQPILRPILIAILAYPVKGFAR